MGHGSLTRAKIPVTKEFPRKFLVFMAQHYKLENWQPRSRVLE